MGGGGGGGGRVQRGPTFCTKLYRPKGLWKADSEWGPFDIFSILMSIDKGV